MVMTIDNSQVEEEFAQAQRQRGQSGSPGDDHRIGAGPEDDIAEDGYDDSQRAEILEVESLGPRGARGVVQTDIVPDLGGGDADDDEIEDDADRLDQIEDTDEPFTRED
jgi:hypothetical protein